MINISQVDCQLFQVNLNIQSDVINLDINYYILQNINNRTNEKDQ